MHQEAPAPLFLLASLAGIELPVLPDVQFDSANVEEKQEPFERVNIK